jgi:hypothetical protein
MPMTQSDMLHQMCHETLSAADLKAISQSRGFSAAEAGSRALFESFFLSDIGVASALQSLTQEEVVLLHLLHSHAAPVAIPFFGRVYAQGGAYGTFTQRYQPVLQAVRTGLVRRGLLLMAESGDVRDGETKMERWRFHFPQQFARLLPPLLPVPPTFAAAGAINHAVVREKVMSLFAKKHFGLYAANLPQYEMTITHGELLMGDQRFAVTIVQGWQQACWEAAAPKASATKNVYDLSLQNELSPVAAARYAFGQLPPDAWLTPAQLTPILKVFCADPKPDATKLCLAGWEWGCLARHTVNGTAHYRLPALQSEYADRRLGAALTIDGAEIKVDLARIDYADLEILAQVATWKVAASQLLATPALVKLGNLTPALRAHPLLQWLQANAPVYAQAVRTVARRWGKQIIHENLLVAKVNDLSLKVAIEKTLADDEHLLWLPNNFIAFPRSLLPAIDRLVKQAGHVIKQVQPSEGK